jgi:hypothetical protein
MTGPRICVNVRTTGEPAEPLGKKRESRVGGGGVIDHEASRAAMRLKSAPLFQRALPI